MSQPSLELTVEVNIFEYLEQITGLTLGELTHLRVQSRTQQVNLLFLAYQEGKINQQQAEQMAKDLGINSQFAPWEINKREINKREINKREIDKQEINKQETDKHNLNTGYDYHRISNQPKSHQPKNNQELSPSTHNSLLHASYSSRRKFGERASLTEAIHQASQQASQHESELNESSINEARKVKRQFSDVELKTTIEINLPSFIEESHTPFNEERSAQYNSQNLESSTNESLHSSSMHSSTSLGTSKNTDRWTQLQYKGSVQCFERSIHRYDVYDMLTQSRFELSSHTQVNDLYALEEVKYFEANELLKIYQAVNQWIRPYSLVNLSRLSNQDLVYWRVAPKGHSLDVYFSKVEVENRVNTAIKLIKALVKSLIKAHEHGLIHRKLEPQCIYVDEVTSQTVSQAIGWTVNQTMRTEEISLPIIMIEQWEHALYTTHLNHDSKQPDATLSTHILSKQDRSSVWRAPEIEIQDILTLEQWIQADVYGVSALMYWALSGSQPLTNLAQCNQHLRQILSPTEYTWGELCIAGLSAQPNQRPSLKDFYQKL